jgi:hypothetical protein
MEGDMSVANTYTISSRASWPTGTSVDYYVDWSDGAADVAYRPPVWQPSTWDDQPKIWGCIYCGAKHWIKNEELQCRKCGAPREDV